MDTKKLIKAIQLLIKEEVKREVSKREKVLRASIIKEMKESKPMEVKDDPLEINHIFEETKQPSKPQSFTNNSMLNEMLNCILHISPSIASYMLVVEIHTFSTRYQAMFKTTVSKGHNLSNLIKSISDIQQSRQREQEISDQRKASKEQTIVSEGQLAECHERLSSLDQEKKSMREIQ